MAVIWFRFLFLQLSTISNLLDSIFSVFRMELELECSILIITTWAIIRIETGATEKLLKRSKPRKNIIYSKAKHRRVFFFYIY